MALSRRSFVRTVGLGSVSSAFIAARGQEKPLAASLRDVANQTAQTGRAAAPIKISSNENPRGPSPAALEAIRGRTTFAVGRYPDNVDALTEVMEPDALDKLAESLQAAEATAPTRPHPYAPHTGVAGSVSRKVLHAVDAFWDTAEARMAPEPEPPAKPKPGLMWQYLLADPRFDEEEEPTT